jgi:hypothetical protein
LCKVLLQDWIWVKSPLNSRLKSISIPTDFSVQWPLISLTRSYKSKAVFAVNHNASLFLYQKMKLIPKKSKLERKNNHKHLTVPDSVRFLQKRTLLVLFLIAWSWTMNKKCSKVIKSLLGTEQNTMTTHNHTLMVWRCVFSPFNRECGVFNTCFSNFTEGCTNPNISVYSFNLATFPSY